MSEARILNTLSDKHVTGLLIDGATGIIPTDTVYGLACSANNQQAVKRLYGLKGREDKPGTVIAASIDQLVELGIKRRYLTAVENFWPGPISIVIPSYELSHIHLGVGSIAVRIPDDEKLQAFLKINGPVLTTSANHAGQPPAINLQQAKEYFGNEVDFYVDGGDLSSRKPSTIIRIVDDAVEILREGAVKIDEETGKILS